jgi:histone chaperone ASF1
VTILNNPSPFKSPFSFEITFEVIAPLEFDLEFKIIYVGSADDDARDQVLESVMVGPVPVGTSKFVLDAPPPNIALLPESEVLGVTVVLLTCSYMSKEFVRVGYYVNNEYADEELKENPPAATDFDKLTRSILADKPRVFYYLLIIGNSFCYSMGEISACSSIRYISAIGSSIAGNDDLIF